MADTNLRPWFFETETGNIMRDNAVDWLLWSLFSTHTGEYTEEWEEEIEGYLNKFGEYLGYSLERGRNPRMQCMRLTLDPVVMCHRPFVWYMVSSLYV